jgi:hypothetical protein
MLAYDFDFCFCVIQIENGRVVQLFILSDKEISMRVSGSRSVPCIESLEGRLMLSATYTCGPTFITFTGDPAAMSTVTVSDDGTNFTVTGATKVGSGTLPTLANADKVTVKYTSKNQADSFTYNAVTTVAHPLKSLTYNGGKAGDTANVQAGYIKDVTLKGGDGVNSFLVSGDTVNIIGKLTIKGGKNDDTVTLGGNAGTNILGDINVDMGAADVSSQNTFTIQDGTFGTAAHTTAPVRPATKINVLGGKNADQVIISSSPAVNGSLSIKLNDGNDAVVVNGGTNTGTMTFGSDVMIDAGKGDDNVSIDTSSNLATATFDKKLSILLGDGNDELELGGGQAGNDITINGNLNIDFGKSDWVTGDTFNIGTAGVSTHVYFNGLTNVIHFGKAGLKDTDNVNANSIVLGADSNTSFGVKKGSDVNFTDDLNYELCSALQGFTGVIGQLHLGYI